MNEQLNTFELSRNWFNFCFENPEKIKPIHSAIYFFSIEHCNRLGWKKKFGFPSQMVMEALGIKNWRTYSKGLNDLVDFGFIEMIETSKNQYSSNIIAIVKNTKAQYKALDKALSKHSTKHSTKQGQSTVSINKQYNKEQRTNEDLEIGFYNDVNNWFNSDSFKKSWFEFVKILKDKNKPHSDSNLNNRFESLMKLSNYKLNVAEKIIENSIVSEWVTFYALKEEDLIKAEIKPYEEMDEKEKFAHRQYKLNGN